MFALRNFFILVSVFSYVSCNYARNRLRTVSESAENNGEIPACKCINGDCVKKGSDYKCVCPNEYGKLSDTECMACGCGKDSNCTFSSWLILKTCVCKPGYKEIKNTCVGPCTNNPCGNGGTCEDVKNGYKCNCLPGYIGNNCEIKECKCGDRTKSCSFDAEGAKQCICEDGYALINDECTETCSLDSDCGFKGTCTIEEKFCNCGVGLSGDKCNIIDDCSLNGAYENCIGLANCTYNAQEQKAECVCPGKERWNPHEKKCEVCDCGAQAIDCEFTSAGTKKCECVDNFEQKDNICTETCSQDTDCVINGRCTLDGQFCECKKGISGDKCDVIDDCGIKGKYKDCLKGGGNCTYDTNNETAVCLCSGTKKWNPAENSCKETCSQDIDCGWKGNCTVEGTFCKCGAGLSGDLCDTIDDCGMNGTFEDCSGRAYCTYNAKKEKAECVCPGKERWNPGKNKCEICDCGDAMTHCKFTSTGIMRCKCVDGFDQKGNKCTETCRKDRDCGLKGTCSIEGKFCKCGSGLSGDKCDTVDDCGMNGRYEDCIGRAKCKYNATKETAECVCPGKEKWNPIRNNCEICDCGAKMIHCEFTPTGTMKCEYEDGFGQREKRFSGDTVLLILVACFGCFTVLSTILILYIVIHGRRK